MDFTFEKKMLWKELCEKTPDIFKHQESQMEIQKRVKQSHRVVLIILKAREKFPYLPT